MNDFIVGLTLHKINADRTFQRVILYMGPILWQILYGSSVSRYGIEIKCLKMRQCHLEATKRFRFISDSSLSVQK